MYYMQIGNIKLKNNLILAPMAGISDVAFRSLAVESGADYAVTEMISAKALEFNSKKTIEMLKTAKNEKIKVVQLFGHEPEIMAKACNNPYLKKFDIIDINMGCPAPKIVKNNEGCALMKNIKLAEKIIKECVAVSLKPITVKFRLGWDEKNINAVKFAKMCEAAGASAITIHGRTQTQGYSGGVNLNIIKDVVEAVKIPVIGNGDVLSANDYNNMLSLGVSAVMIGRGALGNLKLFNEISKKKIKYSQKETLLKHIDILLEYYPNIFVVKHMRKHILWYLKHLKNINEIKKQIIKETDLIKVKELINIAFKQTE